MTSHRQDSSEIEFGSDSFLDVVANLVGILIILIVVAGIRVSQMPAPHVAQLEEEKAEIADAEIAEEPTPPVLPGPDLQALPEEEEPFVAAEFGPLVDDSTLTELPPEPFDPPHLQAIHPPREDRALKRQRLQQRDQLKRSLEESKTRLAELSSRVEQQQGGIKRLEEENRQLSKEKDDLRARLEVEQSLLKRKVKDLEQAKESLAQLQSLHAEQSRRNQQLAQTLEKLDGELVKVESRQQALEDEAAPVTELKHDATPVSQVIQGKEYHLRLHRNKVSIAPIDELVDRIKSQVERRKEWIARHGVHEGIVGPIDGYSMTYRVRKQRPTLAEELRYGGTAFRIAAERWELTPGYNIQAESAEEAVRPGSRLIDFLANLEPQASVTVWVYPDSFDLYRTIQQMCHDRGITIAARPLPAGTAIAASPNGSKSLGQ